VTRPSLVWLRRDLRLTDQPALAEAARRGPVVAVHVLDQAAPWALGAAARWWLHHSLAALGRDIAARGGVLVLRQGDAVEELLRAASECDAAALFWCRHDEPAQQAAEARLTAALTAAGIEPAPCRGDTLFPPGSVRGRQGQPLQVFTPFWRAALERPSPPAPVPAPEVFVRPARLPAGASLPELPRPRWWDGLASRWQPGEAGAGHRLDTFLAAGLEGYARERDRPDHDGSSRLSPHLAFGEISPRQIWQAVSAGPQSEATRGFLRELGWREFSRHLLARTPTLPERPLKPEFDAFPWRDDPAGFAAWCRGATGFPIVDAGMRQLWTTGWMHNRVRMIAASFLVKDLLVNWSIGQGWFWDTLVDADLASNAASWQWVAGCGADAAPFFRIFNPVLQGEKFDPDGSYVRTWVPELAHLPGQAIHRPWDHGGPAPLLDHKMARDRALAALRTLRPSPAGD
jgi:deoxyribodipyrimidine photo-lyase